MEKANTVLMSISKIYIFIRAKVFYLFIYYYLKQQPIKNIFFLLCSKKSEFTKKWEALKTARGMRISKIAEIKKVE